MPARKTDKTSKPAVPKPAKRTAAKGKVATKLPETMITDGPFAETREVLGGY